MTGLGDEAKAGAMLQEMQSHRGLRHPQRPLILFGGGLDSCVMVELYHHLDPVLLYFDYGQKAAAGERKALRYYSAKYDLAFLAAHIDPALVPASPLTSGPMVVNASDHAQNYIPGRNLMFASLAYSYASANSLCPVLLGASPAPPEGVFFDAKIDFMIQFNRLAQGAYPDDPTYMHLPLVLGNRLEYVHTALKKEPRLFEVSFTCYESKTEEECGLCVHCQQKSELRRQLFSEPHTGYSD